MIVGADDVHWLKPHLSCITLVWHLVITIPNHFQWTRKARKKEQNVACLQRPTTRNGEGLRAIWEALGMTGSQMAAVSTYPAISKADDESSIPFTRSNVFNG